MAEKNNYPTRRTFLATGIAITAANTVSQSLTADVTAGENHKTNRLPDVTAACIDGVDPGWVALGEKDFVRVNGNEDTWTWKDGVAYCTGNPVSVFRSVKKYTNFEFVLQWKHMRHGGNSGVFAWADIELLNQLEKSGKKGLPRTGIEIQVLDPGYQENWIKNHQGKKSNWFTCHGDLFAVGKSKMKPFPPLSANKHRSFPSEERTRPNNHWNHYYVRGINGEIRLWVNGKEVSGGNQCKPASGHFCLESEGSPVQFKNFRIRELP